jgi:hypothetical protein
VLERLRAFAQSGGRVVFLGQTPSLVVGGSFLKAETPRAGDFDWAIVEASGDLTRRVLDALPGPAVALEPAPPGVKCLKRRWQDADLYFLFNETDQAQSLQATLAGQNQPAIWDAMSGRVAPAGGRAEGKDAWRLPLTLAPYESRFLVEKRR